MKKLTIIGIPGSLREKSYNRMLLNAAVKTLDENVHLEYATIKDIPLYNQDDEEHKGIPAAVKELQDQIVACDGLLLVTPEYNHSIPGVFKNAIDYLSRPPKDTDRVFKDLPVGLIGATPSGRGTIGAQDSWLVVLNALKVNLFTGSSLGVSKAHEVFGEDGTIKDAKIQKQLNDYMKGYVDFVREFRRTHR